jgi:Uma2 family endonuclease
MLKENSSLCHLLAGKAVVGMLKSFFNSKPGQKRIKQVRSLTRQTVSQLPNGAVRAPDACWVSNEQLAKLTDEELEAFPPLCPEFVIELRSATDGLKTLQEKMLEYIANGTQLGWLLDTRSKNVYVYTPDGATLLEAPEKVKGAGRLEGSELDLLEVW